ncbi:MAG: auracyanin, partial [Chloroflexus sp.]|nr:auracyanin [Chloroflexus sp.]
MKMWSRMLTLVVLTLMALALAACGGGGSSSGGATGGSGSGPVTLEIGSKGEELVFDKTELRVSAG